MYVANGVSNTVSVINSSSNTVVATIPIGGFGAYQQSNKTGNGRTNILVPNTPTSSQQSSKVGNAAPAASNGNAAHTTNNYHITNNYHPGKYSKNYHPGKYYHGKYYHGKYYHGKYYYGKYYKRCSVRYGHMRCVVYR